MISASRNDFYEWRYKYDLKDNFVFLDGVPNILCWNCSVKLSILRIETTTHILAQKS